MFSLRKCERNKTVANCVDVGHKSSTNDDRKGEKQAEDKVGTYFLKINIFSLKQH
jgi:hypothetical protein